MAMMGFLKYFEWFLSNPPVFTLTLYPVPLTALHQLVREGGMKAATKTLQDLYTALNQVRYRTETSIFLNAAR
jgi:hypothetical protein